MGYAQSWLDDISKRRCILVELKAYSLDASTEVTFYLGSQAYRTSDSNYFFDPRISGEFTFSETLSTEGGASVSYGNLEVNNSDAALDNWLRSDKYIWANRGITVYHGDPSWVSTDYNSFTSQFTVVFSGLIGDINISDKNTILFYLYDKTQKLNGPVSENILGPYGTWAGGQTNKESIKPIVLGEVHNITPLNIDPSLLEYMVNDGDTESILEIRDNGVPIYDNLGTYTAATVTLASGKFKLSHPLAGVCTATVQGMKLSSNAQFTASSATYNNTLAHVISALVTQFGNNDMKLSYTELDYVNFMNFEAGNPSPVGVYISDRSNMLELCSDIVKSVKATIFFSRVGKLQLLQIGAYTQDPPVTITKSDMILDSFVMSERTKPISAVKLGYAKNWTVQSDLKTAIPEEHINLYGMEWLTVSQVDATKRQLYKQFTEPEQQDTYLIVRGEDSPTPSAGTASKEAKRQLDYFSTVRTVYKFIGISRLLSLKLGQEVVLTYDRFGLNSGVSGQVVYLAPNWIRGTVEVGVII